jgi:hypothetical protein
MGRLGIALKGYRGPFREALNEADKSINSPDIVPYIRILQGDHAIKDREFSGNLDGFWQGSLPPGIRASPRIPMLGKK